MKSRAGDDEERNTSRKGDPAVREARARLPALPSEWASVDALMRDLGSAVAAATDARPRVDTTAADAAIREAAEAVNRTIAAPGNGKLLAAAREAIRRAHDIIARLPRD